MEVYRLHDLQFLKLVTQEVTIHTLKNLKGKMRKQLKGL